MKTQIKLLLLPALWLLSYNLKAQCTANFSYSVGTAGVVEFVDYSVSDSSTSYTYSWDFGDGTNSTDSSYIFNHTYASGGSYVACLTVSNTFLGCNQSMCDTIQINLCGGAATFGYLQTGFRTYIFNPANLAAHPGATLLWNFGDGTTDNTANPTHQFRTGALYNVCLTLYDAAQSCTDSQCISLWVPQCSFPAIIDTMDVSYNPAVISFQNPNPTGGYNYEWLFGDGNSANGSSASNTYTESGTYTVQLCTYDAASGCHDTTSEVIGVYKCAFAFAVQEWSNGTNASFDAQMLNTFDSLNWNQNITFNWSFPNGTPNTASGSSANINYAQLGNYSACLFAASNTGCIDTFCSSFTLTVAHYSVSGEMLTGGTGACGIVYLIVQDTIGHLTLMDSAVVNAGDSGFICSGYYMFNYLPVDTYYLKAALVPGDANYADYLPTYWGDVLNWANAEGFGLVNGDATNFNINLVAGNNPGGPGFVGGWVSQGAGIVNNGTGNNHRGERSPGDPMANVQINLLTAGGQAVTYTYTNANGHYQFSGLALGSYQLYAEALSKIPEPINFTLTQDNPVDSSINMSINSSTATGVDEVNAVLLSGLYPNPVVSELQVKLGSKQAVNATIKLLNVLGQTEMERTAKLSIGENSLNIDMEKFAAGVYQLVIISRDQQSSYKVVKAR